jgi:ABC-2 type transport system permease protein
MGRRIWQMMKKEFIQVWRDRRLRIFLILPPIIQLIIYGYAINFDIRQVPFGVFDEDRTQASELLISRFTASEYFLLTDAINSESELKGLIDRSRIPLAVHIPKGFAAKDQGQSAGAAAAHPGRYRFQHRLDCG